MTLPIAEDYADIARRAAEIKAGNAPVYTAPDCKTCMDIGWLCVQIGPPKKHDVCFRCGNPRGKGTPE